MSPMDAFGGTGERGIINVLLVEDDDGDALLLEESLCECGEGRVALSRASSLSAGVAHLESPGADVVLLDLHLGDSRGIATFTRLHDAYPALPVIVLSGLDDTEIALNSVYLGAQDYLVKGEVTGSHVFRAITYALERQRIVDELRSVSVTDELTGLYNRRGLVNAVGQSLLNHKLGEDGRRTWVFYADLDRLKWINDNLGHREGDRAIQAVSNILRQVFRRGDAIARVGGDEFVVVADRVPEDVANNLVKRLDLCINDFNRSDSLPYKLSVSVGSVCYDPAHHTSLDDVLGRADELMYETKRARKEV